MSEDESRQLEETGPTIDSIDLVDFGSHEPLKELVDKKASGFVR
jgi:hypothetical protein